MQNWQTKSGFENGDGVDDSLVEFTRTLLRIQESSAYGTFCERVYGRDLRQLNAVDEEQLQKLLSSLHLNESHRVLDLGCGGGFISEYISDITGAKVTGIDFVDDIIKSAQKRTLLKKDRLTFLTADLNNLSETFEKKILSASDKFNYIISIDALYFVDDITDIIKSMKRLLRPGGQFATFYTYKKQVGDEGNKLNPKQNKLGKALTSSGFRYVTYDFTENEKLIWLKTKQAAEDLKQSFITEGHQKTYEERIWEANRNLIASNESRSARSFYLTKPK